MSPAEDSGDGQKVLVLEGLDERVCFSDNEAGYRKAQRLLNKADFGVITLTDSDREKLNAFIREYQTKRLRL